MARKFDTGEPESAGPEELVIRAFSRCSNYPKECAGVLGMAQGLRAASDKFGVPMVAIIAECTASSTFCPTDHDLLEVARSLRRPKDIHVKVCEECYDTGFRHIEREVEDCVMARKVTVSAAEHCSCSKGKWLADKARERAIALPPAGPKGLQKAGFA